jgi:hypothetical protein
VQLARGVGKHRQAVVLRNKEEGLRAREVEASTTVARFAELYAAYDEQCQREGVVDFAELLLRSYELLSRNELLREHYRGASATSWWTSSRTPTACSTAGSSCSPAAAKRHLRGGRRRPVDLRVPRRQRRQHADFERDFRVER